jgi:uncharacterized SAM-binding protein YcdF (DUF218 family)
MPLIAFILIAILCLALLGVACACMSDHPLRALEQALAAIPALPALVEVWALAAVALFGSGALFAQSANPRARGPSVVSLQRFLL